MAAYFAGSDRELAAQRQDSSRNHAWCKLPDAIFWGTDQIFLYNDAWRTLISEQHPVALGRPAREIFSEVWDQLELVLTSVLASGKAAAIRDSWVPALGGEETAKPRLSHSFNPIPGDNGLVAGVLAIPCEQCTSVNETPARELVEHTPSNTDPEAPRLEKDSNRQLAAFEYLQLSPGTLRRRTSFNAHSAGREISRNSHSGARIRH